MEWYCEITVVMVSHWNYMFFLMFVKILSVLCKILIVLFAWAFSSYPPFI